MLANELEYRSARIALSRLQAALDQNRGSEGDNQDPLAREVIQVGLEGEIFLVRRDIEQYEALKAQRLDHVDCDSLAKLPEALIAARIAVGWSQSELAQHMELKPQQIQRYEASRYTASSFARLVEIAGVLSVHFRLRATFQNVGSADVASEGGRATSTDAANEESKTVPSGQQMHLTKERVRGDAFTNPRNELAPIEDDAALAA